MIIKYVMLFVICFLNIVGHAGSLKLEIHENEKWWGAVVDDGYLMPFPAKVTYLHDLNFHNKANQIQPLLISNFGRYVWCEKAFEFEFFQDSLFLRHADADIVFGEHGSTLRDAFLYACKTFFPASGDMPDPLLFSHPQYNTWIELTYNQNQADVLSYARAIKENDMPLGVFMIDDTWQLDYGMWDFNPARFAEPEMMLNELHDLGFKVMLWICPFVSADSPAFRQASSLQLLIMNRQTGSPVIVEWWNGYSALLDFTNPETNVWFDEILSDLSVRYGIDGFKFDGGDTPHYVGDYVAWDSSACANDHSKAWSMIGLNYPLNEYRASWKMAGQALAQRLHDKNHSWEDLKQLLPNIIAQGLCGYSFVCPDMIGGGEYKSFLNLKNVDQELIVRSAQCHALMPMMQFSVAPWRVLDREKFEICKQATELHVKCADKILRLAEHAAQTGEPIVRHLEYVFPHQGYAQVNDQFLLGDDILVAPVLEKGARSRMIHFPPGVWQDEFGERISGPCHILIKAPLARLPWFVRVKN